MRCPECTQRNSVAARKCQFCGKKLPRKPVPLAVKIGSGVAALVVLLIVGSMFMNGGGSSNKEELKAIADRLSYGPKSPEEAQKLKIELDRALNRYLTDNGSNSSADLLTKLQTKLPTSIFEVFVFDLPKSIKLVEVDCVLQPSDFLIVNNGKTTRVTQIFGLDVFDKAKLLKDSSGETLVLLGHTNADLKKIPTIKAISLLPNGNIADRTSKLVPSIKGKGTIGFADKSNNIRIERNLVSTAKDEELFKGDLPFKDENFTTILEWKNGRYDSEYALGNNEFAPLYAVATALAEPSELDEFNIYLDDSLDDFFKSISSNPVNSPPGFRVAKMKEVKVPENRRRRRRAKTLNVATYKLVSGKRTFDVVITGGKGKRWTAKHIEEATSDTVADAGDTADSKIVVAKPKDTGMTPEPLKQTRKAERKKTEQPKAAAVKVARKPEPRKEKPQKKDLPKKDKTKIASASPISGGTARTAKRVTVRTGPGTAFKKISITRQGQNLKVVGKQKGWYKVEVGGRQGFVWGGLVDYKKSDGYTTAVVRKKKAVRDSRKRQVSTAKVGEKLVIIGGLKNDKYKVRLADGKTGFVEKDAIDVAVEEPAFVP